MVNLMVERAGRHQHNQVIEANIPLVGQVDISMPSNVMCWEEQSIPAWPEPGSEETLLDPGAETTYRT